MKKAAVLRVMLPQAKHADQRWSMDFAADSTLAGRRFRALAIVDDYSRECPTIEVDSSIPGAKVVDVLERLAETRELPEVITVDNGPAFVVSADYNLFEILTGQVLSLDQMDKLLDEPLKGLWEMFKNTEWWIEEDISRAKKEATEKGLMKDSEGPRLDSIK